MNPRKFVLLDCNGRRGESKGWAGGDLRIGAGGELKIEGLPRF
jgi:hypothetical protein